MKRIVRTSGETGGAISYEDAMFDQLLQKSTLSLGGTGHDIVLCHPLRLSFYDKFPVHEIRLEVLEKLAISRLKCRYMSDLLIYSIKGH